MTQDKINLTKELFEKARDDFWNLTSGLSISPINVILNSEEKILQNQAIVSSLDRAIEKLDQHLEALEDQEYKGTLQTADQYIMHESFKRQLLEKRDYLKSIHDGKEIET